MEFEKLKDEVKAIAEIAESVPDAFKERCFELLLENLLKSIAPLEPNKPAQKAPPVASAQNPQQNDTQSSSTDSSGVIPTPSQIKVFMGKTGVTGAELAKVVMYEENAVHFVQEPDGTKIARGQIQWSLLLALKRGIEKNVLEVDPEVVRSICQEKGFYDATNFQKNFKTAANAKLFMGEMEKQGAAQRLSNDGLSELGKMIKEFAARPAE